MSDKKTDPQGITAGRRRRTVVISRALFVISLLAIALGVALGHTWITWLNATLL